MKTDWPKKPISWITERALHISIPFTWDLPKVRADLKQKSMFWDNAVVGGPAVYLMPDFFNNLDHVKIGYDAPGILQRVNPLATRTTTGCIRKCGFCGVRKFEPEFKELHDWPDLPIICDNNLLASSQPHFDKVIDRLKKWKWADFNQGIDSRLLTDYHASRLSEIKKPIIRLALDNMNYADQWENSFSKLLNAGIAKSNIKSYVLIGFDSDPYEAWDRCEWVENHKIKSLPMWFHPLDSTSKNTVTERQISLGWNDLERKRIMGYYYKHRGEKLVKTA